MDAGEVGPVRRIGRLHVKVADQARHLDQVAQPSLRLGVFGQAAGQRLHKTAHRQGEGIVAAAVPEAAFIGEKGSRHPAVPLRWRKA